MRKHPLWGNFVGYADADLLAFGVLNVEGLRVLAAYHGTQAIEKYLKALCLSAIDPNGEFATPENQAWIRSHNLLKLAERIEVSHPYLANAQTKENLSKFSEYDQATRYPWVDMNRSNGFSSENISVFGEIILILRTSLPITTDDYLLGMEVRGYHQKNKEVPESWNSWPHTAVQSLRIIYPNLDHFVHW